MDIYCLDVRLDQAQWTKYRALYTVVSCGSESNPRDSQSTGGRHSAHSSPLQLLLSQYRIKCK